jgi:secondary thiamine-phosphate synthase enzyme
MSIKSFVTLPVRTSASIQFVDITHEVRRYVAESEVKDGIILVYTPHTTAGITINENADPDVTHDISAFLKQKFPHESYFQHSEGNSPSHLMSSYFGASETFIIDDSQLVLGTWQGIYFCEFDGPRSRNVHFKTIAG